MSYTYDTEPTTSYTRDSSESLIAWADTETTWASAFATWGGNYPFTYDTELSTSYTNDTL